MGLNLNLVQMLGLPKKAECPHCKKTVSLWFDDFDIEAGEIPSNGVFKIRKTECPECEKEFSVTCKLRLAETKVTKS